MLHAVANLVYLTFASNTCYVTVAEVKPKDVTLDLENGTWSTTAVERGMKSTFEIGAYRTYFDDGRYGTIGVFNRTNIKHLNSLAHAATTAVRERGSMLDD
jgi:hypothetical protein